MIIGIDPGLDGAMATTETIVGFRVQTYPTSQESNFISDWTRVLNAPFTLREIVVIEKVHSMPKQGVSSSFKFGMVYGQVIGMCQTLGVPYILVTPTTWKKQVLKDFNWKGRKQASIEYVRQMYPEVELKRTPQCRTPHTGIADAICLADYGRWYVNGRKNDKA